MTGVDLAQILYKKGFTNLYWATGHPFKQEDMPEYLRVLESKLKILEL
jgi:hypothetical protein